MNVGFKTLTGGNTVANNNFDLEAVLSGVRSRFIQLRISWYSVKDWAPALAGLWVEYEVLDQPSRRRKWQLRIHARDQEVDRDGQTMARTGRQLITDLWQAWENDSIITFRDIDYDDAPVQRNVRIVGISEAAQSPADEPRWANSIINLNLVEV